MSDIAATSPIYIYIFLPANMTIMLSHPVVELLNASVPAKINISFQTRGARPHANCLIRSSSAINAVEVPYTESMC